VRPTADDLGILSQIFYLQKDCKNSGLVGRIRPIAAARKGGRGPPRKNLYQFKPAMCLRTRATRPGMAATLG